MNKETNETLFKFAAETQSKIKLYPIAEINWKSEQDRVDITL